MSFLVLAALIIIGVVICLIISFIKGKNKNISYESADADLEIYQMQLKEIGRDSARGLIDNDSAEEARLEIARSILKLDKLKKNKKTQNGYFVGFIVLIISILIIIPMTIGVYAFLGSPQLPEHPFYVLMEKDPKDLSVQENMARLEVLALRNPNDAKTAEELAFHYLMVNRFKDAANRFNNAIVLDGENANRLTGLGIAFVGDEDGIVSENAQKLFEKAVSLDENQYFAQLYLAQVSMQNKRPDLALERLQALYNRLPKDSPERQQLKNQIDTLVASMKEQKSEDLLEQVYETVQKNPDSLEGWMLLVKTWANMGNKEKAEAILREGVGKLSPEKAEKLTLFAKDMGLTLTKGETSDE